MLNISKTTAAISNLFKSCEDKPLNSQKTPDRLTRVDQRHVEMLKIYFLDHYVDLLTYLDDRKKRSADVKSISGDWKKHTFRERGILRKRRLRIRLSNFQILSQIGQGGYGQVFLAKNRDTNVYCALKQMSKKLLVKLGEQSHILTERDILTKTNSPWLVRLLYAFQDMDNVYLVMEYVQGGDFRTLLNATGVLHEPHARFYFAEMAQAVFTLHDLGYIHRDLKPENFLIDSTGHIKLTDFGLSRGKLSGEVVDGLKKKLEMIKNANVNHESFSERYNTYQTVRKETRAFTVVGSPDYMAIEVLNRDKDGYTKAADYWSLGCILFEIVCGFPPFTASSTDKVWVNLYNWEKVLGRPEYEGADAEFNLTDNCWDLITKLIAKKEERYSSPELFKCHPFFNNMDFSKLRVPGAFPVPLVPKLSSQEDTTYFDDFTNPKDLAIYGEIMKREGENRQLVMKDIEGVNSAFVGFTFKHK